jgi:hypothetical protein
MDGTLTFFAICMQVAAVADHVLPFQGSFTNPTSTWLPPISQFSVCSAAHFFFSNFCGFTLFSIAKVFLDRSKNLSNSRQK